jgi:hypothetical protein
VQAKRSVAADTALRLAKFFGTSEVFWLNLQARYDLDVQRQKLGVTSVRPFVRLVMPPLPPRAPRRLSLPLPGAVRSGYKRKAK